LQQDVRTPSCFSAGIPFSLRRWHKGLAMTRIAPAVVRYGLSTLAVAVVVGLNIALGLREHFSTALFLAVVAGCAWYGGLGSGLLVTFFSAFALDYFFVGNEFAFDWNAATWIWLLVFTAVAIFLNLLAESQRRLLIALRAEDRRKTQLSSAGITYRLTCPRSPSN
jgi:K+-sensing histidine kinase KdpD